jgi:pimeloyl-ACP methyl ester carboxylesterase
MSNPCKRPIDTIEKLSIGGIEQWISLRSTDVSNPLILFLHGGPGTAQISFSRKSQRALEDRFVVVNWDQRGAGRSFSKSIPRETMRIDRMVQDAEELVEVLLQRFHQEKLFLVGHSWGTILGIELVSRRAELVHAYVGMGQVVNMKRGEHLSYRFTVEEAEKTGNRRAVRQLSAIGSPPYANLRDAGVQRKWLTKFHGATVKGSVVGALLRNFSLRDTRPLDIVRFVRGAILSLTSLEEPQMQVDFLSTHLKLDVPVYFVCGKRDYNVPFELVVEYATKLAAPRKEVVWFDHSAHLPNWEETERFCDFCISLLADS